MKRPIKRLLMTFDHNTSGRFHTASVGSGLAAFTIAARKSALAVVDLDLTTNLKYKVVVHFIKVTGFVVHSAALIPKEAVSPFPRGEVTTNMCLWSSNGSTSIVEIGDKCSWRNATLRDRALQACFIKSLISHLAESSAKMSRYIRLTAVLSLSCSSAISYAQTPMDIVEIWQSFIASGAAATECKSVNRQSNQKFLTNLTMVTIRAAERLRQIDPALSEADVTIRMKSAGDMVHDKVGAEIKQNGCDAPKIQQLLKLYKMHSTMSL